jgi:hypothetical protein
MYVKSLFIRLLAMCALTGSLAMSGVVHAQNTPSASQALRVTQQVDEMHLVPLKGNTLPLARSRFDRGAVAESTPTGHVTLVLRRSADQEQSLKSYLDSLQNSASPNYRKWLTPAQFGASFGIGDADLQAVEQWLQSHGLKIEKVPQGRNMIQFSGTVGQLQSTFHTSIHSFEINGEHHLANVSDPQIPAALAPVVQGLAHLNDLHPAPQSIQGSTGIYDAATKTIKPAFNLFSGSTPTLYVDPSDAATIYDTPNATLNPNYSGTTYDGTGINLGIVGDSNISLSDVTNYRVAFLGETAASANIPTVVIDGNDPGINGDEPEGLLDNEIAGGLAPKAKIYFYTSSNTDLQAGVFDAIFRAIDDNLVSILSISFGSCEANQGASGNSLILEASEQAAAQGISVVVSSGDSGSAGCDSSGSPAAQYGLAVNALASSPYFMAVGGTDFDVLATDFTSYVDGTSSGTAPYYRTAQKYIPESPWNDSTKVNNSLANNVPLILGGSTNVVAAGGGASAIYAKPAYQTSLTPNDSARDLPDVSLLAANGLYGATWVVCGDGLSGADCQTSNGQLVDGTSFSGYGGTSTSAPAFAGMLALVEQKVGSRLGQANYVLYQLANSKYASVFHDVTTGNNSVYCVGGTLDCNDNSFLSGFDTTTGYDQASGLGSLDVASLIANWNSVSLGATTTSFSINGSTAAINVTHGTKLTFQASVTPSTATGVAGVIDTANEVADGLQNNGQIPITLSGGSGAVIDNGLPGGSYTVYARYGGDTTNAASTSTPAIHVTVAPEDSANSLKVGAYDPATGTPVGGGLTAVPYGSEVFFDALIYGATEGINGTEGIATGNVTFNDNGVTAGQAAVSVSNTASYPPINSRTFPTYAIGAHSVVANYPGDPSYNASTSAPVAFTVVKAATSVDVTASNSSILSVASTTLSVYVNSAGIGAGPTGTITLKLNGNTLGTYPNLSGSFGTSKLTIVLQGSQLAPGSNNIAVIYSGDANYVGSEGTIVIAVSPSKFTLSNSGAITLAAGATTANTATITASPINSFVGIINLTCAVTAEPAGATNPPTCTVPATVSLTGSAAITTSLAVKTTTATTTGSYTITVTGTDAATGKISSSTGVPVTVTAPVANPAFALSSSGNLTIAPGATSGNTSTITVTPTGGLTGAVTLSCAVTTAVASPNDPPTCSIPSSVTITGATAATATLTVSSTAATTAAIADARHKAYGIAAGGSFFAAMIFFGIPHRRRRWSHLVAIFSILIFGAAIGCGGSSSKTTPGNPGTTAGAYVVTVTATATGLAPQTTAVNVTVN